MWAAWPHAALFLDEREASFMTTYCGLTCLSKDETTSSVRSCSPTILSVQSTCLASFSTLRWELHVRVLFFNIFLCSLLRQPWHLRGWKASELVRAEALEVQ